MLRSDSGMSGRFAATYRPWAGDQIGVGRSKSSRHPGGRPNWDALTWWFTTPPAIMFGRRSFVPPVCDRISGWDHQSDPAGVTFSRSRNAATGPLIPPQNPP
jgi:hypothetical protein